MRKTISVIGSGYVGVTTAAIASNAGYTVHLIDINPDRIKVLKSGKSFFYEEGIDALIKHGVENKTLLPSTEYEGIRESQLVISCVGTPDNPDGSSNLEYVFAAAKTACDYLQPGSVYVQKSTVPVGTGSQVKKILPKTTPYVSNPEFLREGTAVSDTLFFDRIVTGGDDSSALELVLDLYRAFEENRDEIANRANIERSGDDGLYIKTNLESAELIKVTANAFLALKISFANSIAKLADKSGADIVDVMDAVGADRRIGRAFLNAGRGYGGGCFPKDVSGLITSASEHGVDMPIMTAATDVNTSMPGYIANKVQEALDGSLKGKTVAVLGLAFKAGTSDARRSPGVALANLLDKLEVNVQAYDPEANEEAEPDLRQGINIVSELNEAIQNTDAIIFAVDWNQFKDFDFTKLSSLKNKPVVVDAMNMFTPSDISDNGLLYLGVGRK